ncbi:MAG TPA: hypothetical protein DCY13_01445 [Verrucomicrobiales bacterium]|nr:hypothetical protein [Verrucomicrobiales bacterium]
MAAKWSPGRWLHGAKRTWDSLAKTGVWIAAVVTGFLLPPPAGAGQFGEANWSRLAQFVIIIAVGLILVVTSRYQRRQHTVAWSVVAGLALVVALGSLFGYLRSATLWTCEHDGLRLVIGSSLTPLGQAFVDANPGIACDQLIFNFAGQVEKIWTIGSIQTRRMWLALIYLGTTPCFTLSILAVVQALNCARKPR